MSTAKNISAVVGENLHTWRMGAGLTQDEVAHWACSLGFEWTQATVAAIETGRREVSLSEFVALPFLAQLAGSADSWNRLASFLPDAPEPDTESTGDGDDSNASAFVLDLRTCVEVQLSPGCWIYTEHLRALLGGHPAGGRKVPKDALVTFRTLGESISSVSETIKASLEAALDDLPAVLRATTDLGIGLLGPRDAEQKAAKKLGVTADDVLAAALTLWGKTLTDERDARAEKQVSGDASPGRLQAIRGHMTRDLLNELQPVLEKKGDTK